MWETVNPEKRIYLVNTVGHIICIKVPLCFKWKKQKNKFICNTISKNHDVLSKFTLEPKTYL